MLDTCTEYDGPNPKLISPWRGPYFVRSRLCLLLYVVFVSKGDKPEEMSVHLARIKRYYAPSTRSAPDFDALDDTFLGTKIPVPDFDNVQSQVVVVVVVVFTLKAVPVSTQYFLTSVLVQLTRTPSVVTG